MGPACGYVTRQIIHSLSALTFRFVKAPLPRFRPVIAGTPPPPAPRLTLWPWQLICPTSPSVSPLQPMCFRSRLKWNWRYSSVRRPRLWGRSSWSVSLRSARSRLWVVHVSPIQAIQPCSGASGLNPLKKAPWIWWRNKTASRQLGYSLVKSKTVSSGF